MKNMNSIDRFVRLLLGVISLEWAFFWLAGSGQALAYGLGALLVATAGLPVNQYYKQTLFLTGKNEREKALENYVQLLPAFQAFKEKYAAYRPYALSEDTQLAVDLAKLSTMVMSTGVVALAEIGDKTQIATRGVMTLFKVETRLR